MSVTETTRLVRTRGGSMVHKRSCRYAVNFTPWVWAEGRTNAYIRDVIDGAEVKTCKACVPLGDAE